MAKYLDKWKDLFPDTVGGTTRPSEAVSDQEEFNTDGFPQFIAQDPVNYALQNAFLKQFLSNDAWLWVKQKQANQALDDHKVDTQAHAKGISGNAGSATKLANARTIKLLGAVTADAASFDGTADATINVKTLDASKLKGTTSVSTTGNAATATKVVTTAANGASANIAEARMANNDVARIRVSGADNAGELALETADDGNEAIVARQYTGDFKDVARTAAILDANGNTSFPGTVVAPKFTGALNGNAATASKLLTPRTISLTGKALGSTTFDGSANAAINVTSVNADTASKLSTARKINITGNATGAAAFDGSGDVSINTTVNESKHAAAATTVNATAPNGGAADLAFGTMAANDYARIRVYGKDDNGALEIATADGGNEPIYARQYSGAYDWPNGRPGTIVNEAAILDSNGNTKFPKNVTAASFTGPLNGNATSATTATALGIVTARPADANVQHGDGKIRYFLATDRMSKNKPPTGDGQIINLAWDNNGGWDCQLFVNNTTGRLNMRGQSAGKWSDWLIGLDSGNFNNYAPKLDGTGARGDKWNISILGGSQYATKAGTAATCTGNSATTTTLNNRGNRNPAANGTKVVSGLNLYQVYNNGYPTTYGNVLSIGGTGGGEILAGWSGTDAGMERLYYRNQRDTGTLAWSAWKTVAYIDDISNYAPSKTGSGASGTWPISISGNASTATNADKLDGYHASDIINRITAANTGGVIAASLTQNGYVKFANGFTVQWGYLGTTHNGNMKVTFPIAFKTIFNLVCDMIGLCTGSSDNGSLNIQSYNTTGASFFNTDDHDGTGLFWRAVGIV